MRRSKPTLLQGRHRRGLTLVEILAVVTLIGILAAVIIPRFAGPSFNAKAQACEVNQGNVEIQAQLWFRNKGAWPSSDLSDIGADVSYFPDGLPRCPVDGSSYDYDSSTQQVNGHAH